MSPSHLSLAGLCASSESASPAGFDYIDDGHETGVWYGIKFGDIDVVCFRGSITVEDWWCDLHTEMVAHPDLGMVHSGFIKNMDVVRAKIATQVRPNPIVTGHSLGAARACLYAGMQALRLHERPTRVVVFGCPRPAGQGLLTALRDVPVISYKNRNDPVTDVPIPLPDLPYVQVREFTCIDGLVDHTLGPIFEDHHMTNYIKGIQNAIHASS